MINQQEHIIEQTKNWIKKIVVGCNFCPFAAKEVSQESIYYRVENGTTSSACSSALIDEFKRLDADTSIGTSFLILPNMFDRFSDYLDYLVLAEKMLTQRKYTGIYQIASFHPHYQFAGTKPEDAANYTNRSIYPMLHILREQKITEALLKYPDPEAIPKRNIEFARKKGPAYMKMLRDSCL